MILHLLDQLPEQVDEILLTVSYMADTIRQYFSNHPLRREVIVVEEKEPLGTGGAVKNVEKYLDDAFIVLNADIISSLGYGEMIDFHARKGGVGAISLFEVDDPTAYGMVTLDQDDGIAAFLEKPVPGEIVSNHINAGTYILELDALDCIPAGRKVSIEREVFPRLIENGSKLYGFPFSGYWIDAGTPEKFLIGQSYILSSLPGNCYVPETAEVRGQLGENVSLGAGVKVERGARLSNCTILDGTVVEEDAVVQDSIIGECCCIRKKSFIKGSVIGDNNTLDGEHVGEKHGGP